MTVKLTRLVLLAFVLIEIVVIAGSPAQAANRIKEFPVPTPNGAPYGIAAGRDGNVWFTEWAANNIGPVTASGVFSEFPVPTPSSHPDGITAGPDGNLWFTEATANSVGRVTTAGVFTEYQIPTPNSYPVAI